MGLTNRANKATLPVKSRPLPETRALLDAHYMPAQPDCRVSELEAAAALVRRRVLAAVAERDQLEAEATDNRNRILEAAIAGDADAVATEIASGAQLAATLVAIGHEVVVATRAASDLGGAALRAHTTDPAYVAWREQCTRMHSRWCDANAMPGGDGPWEDRLAMRERSLRGFAMQAAADLDGLAVTW